MPHRQWLPHVVVGPHVDLTQGVRWDLKGVPWNQPHACHGISPNHDRWLYVQPQHTATMATVSFLQGYFSRLRGVAGVHNCQHGHFLKVVPEIDQLHINFSFAFVANPFRRVMSSAAMHGTWTNLAMLQHTQQDTCTQRTSPTYRLMVWSLVPGALPAALPQTPTEEQLARFNEWVLRFPFPASDAQPLSPWPQVAALCPRTQPTLCPLYARLLPARHLILCPHAGCNGTPPHNHPTPRPNPTQSSPNPRRR